MPPKRRQQRPRGGADPGAGCSGSACSCCLWAHSRSGYGGITRSTGRSWTLPSSRPISYRMSTSRPLRRVSANCTSRCRGRRSPSRPQIFMRAPAGTYPSYVDIGDHVKAGQLLAEITAPEVEAQVAQYQNTLQQAQATVRQNEAQRASTDVTSRRISVLAKDSWATQEPADTDRYNFQAQQHATTAAQYNAAAMEQQLKFVNQQKIYQQVVAPFDGVITQRNIDTGSLITADATGGTSMFSLQRGDVIRVWVYVPQDAAFGVKPGIEAVIRVPAMPSL